MFRETMNGFMDHNFMKHSQSFTNMNAHAHSCQVEVILSESYSFVLMFFDVIQDGLPILVDPNEPLISIKHWMHRCTMPMGKSAKSCTQLKAEPPYLLRLITKNVAVNSNIVKREKCKY